MYASGLQHFYIDKACKLTEINNMEQYLVSGQLEVCIITNILKDDTYENNLKVLISNILDSFALIDPTKIIDKMKLQVFSHLVDDIGQFGPAICYSTEIFEC